MNELALFAGAGGGILGGKLLGWRTVCAVERDAYAATVLAQRQNDGTLPAFPIWSDVCSFDGKPWRGIVDVVSGGFPCQDISVAGKGAGIEGERSGLWGQMFRIVCEVRPRFVFVENSPALTGRGLGRVLGDLASVGFNAQWGVLGANNVGAPHRRERIWIVAYSKGNGLEKRETKERFRHEFTDLREVVANADGTRQHECTESGNEAWYGIADSSWWQSEPDVGRVADGVAFRVDRIKALGNGQVPQCAAEAFSRLTKNVLV